MMTLAVPDRYHHGRHRHRAYGLTCAQFNELFIATGGRCEICGDRGEDTPHGILFIDHDYDFGMTGVRGLLCNRCNTLLGIHGAHSAASAAYLAAPPWCQGRPAGWPQSEMVRRMFVPPKPGTRRRRPV